MASKNEQGYNDGRVLLQNDFTVSRYELDLKPCLDKFTFDGECAMHVFIKAPTTTIKVHAKELSISSVEFQSFTTDGTVISSPIPCMSITLPSEKEEGEQHESEDEDEDNEDTEATFLFSHPLPVGPAIIRSRFVGQLNNDMAGFYRSNYVDRSGEKKVMASTQFEALDARRAFPCIDEPAAKVYMHIYMITYVCM